MAQSVSHFVWERLHEWGVRRIFGYPGDGINGLVGALDEMVNSTVSCGCEKSCSASRPESVPFSSVVVSKTLTFSPMMSSSKLFPSSSWNLP